MNELLDKTLLIEDDIFKPYSKEEHDTKVKSLSKDEYNFDMPITITIPAFTVTAIAEVTKYKEPSSYRQPVQVRLEIEHKEVGKIVDLAFAEGIAKALNGRIPEDIKAEGVEAGCWTSGIPIALYFYRVEDTVEKDRSWDYYRKVNKGHTE